MKNIQAFTFFQIGTTRLNSFIQKSTASRESFRCGEEIEITMLVSLTGTLPNLW